MLNFINQFDVKIQSAVISTIVSSVIFLLGWIIKFSFESYSINLKLKREYYYEQRKKIKEEFSTTKTALLKAAEDVNFRLHNLKSTILKQNWLDVDRDDWCNPERYYLQSTVYRFSVLFYWLLEIEKSLYSLDTVNADKNDTKYIKFIKALRQIMTDNRLLCELGYKEEDKTNHFYANEMSKYAKFCLNENSEVMDFEDFYEVFCEKCSDYEKFIQFFTSVKNEKKNMNYSTLKCLHIILIAFLNNFGHQYQKTEWRKYKKLLSDYNDLMIKIGFLHFIDRNKMVSEMIRPLRILRMGLLFRYKHKF